jgi:hypothetical protein
MVRNVSGVSSFAELAYLVLEERQALLHKIQALRDLCDEILFRTLGAAAREPVRKAAPRQPRSRPGQPRRGT